MFKLARICSLLLVPTCIQAVEPTHADVEFGNVDGARLAFDLYQAESSRKNPLIVWVHGGAWRAGSKRSVPIVRLVDHGFTIASVDYRLSPVAQFPAQVHDIKAAIRHLRASSRTYRIDAKKILIAGASAGGHLAALVGVTNGVTELEGTVGDYPEVPSNVQGIVSFYGASNLQSILSQSTPHGLGVRVPALKLLLGGQPDSNPHLARLTQLASPVSHVDSNDPPLLLIHGDQDPQMPINQSHELHGKYKQLGLPVKFEVVHGGAHGGKGYYEDEMLERVARHVAGWIEAFD